MLRNTFVSKKTNRDKVESEDDIVPYIMKTVPRGTPASQAVQGSLNTQPYIIVFENDEFSQFFIAVESTMILESQTLLTEMFNLLATFYVFNLDYPAKGRDFLLFLQEKICNLPTEGKLKRGANAVLINNGINRCFKEIMSDQYQESS